MLDQASMVTIAANLGVKDEAEILERSIAHLRAIGVDLVIAVDLESVDGSADILDAHSRLGDLVVIPMTDADVHETDRWAREPVDVAREAGADWLLQLDADEFWLPRTGSLRDIAKLEDADVLSIARYNVVLTTDGPALPDDLRPSQYDDVQLVCEPVAGVSPQVASETGLGWLRVIPLPKIMARPAVTAWVEHGQHDAVPLPGTSPRRADARDMVIAHVPMTTLGRFERKVENIRRLAMAQPRFFDRYGWHWMRWVKMADEGRLAEEFERCEWSPGTVDHLRHDGVIRSAAELLTDV